jgi:hypothetical protein
VLARVPDGSVWAPRAWTAAVALLALGACARHDAPERAEAAPAPSTSAPAVDSGVARDAHADVVAQVDAAGVLAADVAERIRDARAQFGAAARIRTVGDTFVLVEVGRPTPLFAEAAALIERALPPLFDGRFRVHPDLGVTVLFFPDAAAYAAHCRARNPNAGVVLGMYRREGREIAVDVSRGVGYLPTLTHEIIHPLVQADFPDAPLWFNEGLAALFEAPVFGKDGSIHGQPRNWRHGQLQAALASPAGRTEARLDGLFGMSPRAFKGWADKGVTKEQAAEIEALNYARARSMCTWLDEQGELWPFYRAWRDGYASDKTGEKAFARVVGGTPKEMNAKWVGWAR